MADLAEKQLRKKIPNIGSKIARVEQAIEEQMHP
jgi:hypothetical protein